MKLRIRSTSAAAAVCLLAAALAPAAAQQLARPGVIGSSPVPEAWWQHAVFYEIQAAAPNDYKTLTEQLDAFHALGIDALLVPAPALDPQSTAAQGTRAAAPDAALDDFDDLVHHASRYGVRVLLDLQAATATPDLARFFLSRGVAGFHLIVSPDATPQEAAADAALAQILRKATAAAVGQRIVLADLNGASIAAVPAPTPPSGHPSTAHRSTTRRTTRTYDTVAPELQIDARLSQLGLPEAANIRTLLAQSLSQPNTILDFHPTASPTGEPNPYPALADPIAAILLTMHEAALLHANAALVPPPTPPAPTPEPAHEPAAPTGPQPTFHITLPERPKPAPETAPAEHPLADFYRELSVLHHGNAALRAGKPILLNFDAQNALVWVDRPAVISTLTPAVVVACNLSSAPVQLDLATAIKGLDLHGNYLRTLLRSDKAMGPQDINAVVLPPFSVYIGELRR